MVRDRIEASSEQQLQIRLISNRQTNDRQYNSPSTSEIAALIIGDLGEAIDGRDIIIHNKINGLRRLEEKHPSYMALQYPILFPYGVDGFHDDVPYSTNTSRRRTKKKCVTIREFYAYRLQQRNEDGKTLRTYGRLFQQYMVDA